MLTRTATAPDGAVWRVRVLWRPRRKSLYRRFREWRWGRRPDDLDIPGGEGFFDDFFVILGMILFVLSVLALLWWWVVPLLLLLLDAVLLVVFFIGAVAGRVLFRRPWTVEAVNGEAVHTEYVVGFGNAGRARDDLARRIAAGRGPAGRPG